MISSRWPVNISMLRISRDQNRCIMLTDPVRESGNRASDIRDKVYTPLNLLTLSNLVTRDSQADSSDYSLTTDHRPPTTDHHD